MNIQYEINDVVELCATCEAVAEVECIKGSYVCEGCKHRIFTKHGIEGELVAPFHFNSVSELIYHTQDSCPLVSRWRKVDKEPSKPTLEYMLNKSREVPTLVQELIKFRI